MKKSFFSISLLCLLSLSLVAQSNRVEVIVHKKNGDKIEAMMIPNTSHPWSDQKSISVFDRSLKDEKKIKKKQKTKYKARDIKGYEYDGKYFESKKVMIAGRGDHGSTLKALPNYALIERVEEGPISAYKAYAYPPSVVSGITFEEIYADLRQNPEYFIIRTSDKKLKSMHGVNIEKWIANAPVVSKKFENGEYGNFKRKKKKKLGNFLKGQMENENPSLILKVIAEYNAEINGK